MGNPAKPKKRREYGAGSVFQRCDKARGCPALIDGERPAHECRGMWVGRFELGWDENGRRKTKPVYATTEGAVVRKLRDLKNQVETHGVPTVSSRTTVKAWAETYLKVIVEQKRPNAYRADKGAIDNWIVPTIGTVRLDQLTPAHFRAIKDAQKAKGRSSSTMLRTHVTLNDMLRMALLEGHAIKSSVFKVKRPAIAVNDRDAMTLEQALAVLVEAAKLRHGSRYLVAFLQGARQAEDLGMEWDRANLAEGIGFFDRSWQMQALPYNIARDRKSGFRIPEGYEVRQIRGAVHWVRPKTKAGYRVPPIVEPVRQALLAWQAESAGDPNPYGLIWPRTDGTPRSGKEDDAEWVALQKAAKVRHPSGRYFTIHEARHSTVTILAEMGVPDDVIAAIVGQTKLVAAYKHTRDARTRTALDQLAMRFGLDVPVAIES